MVDLIILYYKKFWDLIILHDDILKKKLIILFIYIYIYIYKHNHKKHLSITLIITEFQI